MERQTVMIFVYAFEMVVSFCFYSRIYQKKIKRPDFAYRSASVYSGIAGI